MKKLAFFVVVAACLIVINNLAHTIYNLWKKNDLIVNVQEEVAAEKKRNLELTEQVKKVEDPSFIEEQARNNLLLTKENEVIVILPTGVLGEKKNLLEVPNWRKWWKLFF
ncbi:MAG: septum formation initiator family protein [Candidatus Levybacteria bacterium]|nr:septum formation initiator family protein [Candidatus Levybacteria bacterium]